MPPVSLVARSARRVGNHGERRNVAVWPVPPLPLPVDLDVGLALSRLRGRLGQGLFAMVAGPDGPEKRARIHDTREPAGSPRTARSAGCTPTRRCSWVGCGPAVAVPAPAGDGRGGPALRLPRRSVGPAAAHQHIPWRSPPSGPPPTPSGRWIGCAGIHRRVHGVAPDGRTYRADDPHLLEWVHTPKWTASAGPSALRRPALDQAGRDDHVADTALVATALGVPDPPRTEAQLRDRIEAYRGELRSTEAAREAARFPLVTPPLPLLARAPYGVIAATSVSMLPAWARLPPGFPYLPPVEATAIRLAGQVMVGGIRWALSANRPRGAV